MKKISIDELIDMVDSRYSLVTIISKRARQIINDEDILIRTPTLKPVAVAIEEFHEGAYEAIYDYDNYLAKKQEEMNKSKSEMQFDDTDNKDEAQPLI